MDKLKVSFIYFTILKSSLVISIAHNILTDTTKEGTLSAPCCKWTETCKSLTSLTVLIWRAFKFLFRKDEIRKYQSSSLP
jgi:hypothetical protein